MKRRTLLTAGALAATGVLGGCSTGRSVDLGGAGGPSGGSAAGAVLNAAIAGEPSAAAHARAAAEVLVDHALAA